MLDGRPMLLSRWPPGSRSESGEQMAVRRREFLAGSVAAALFARSRWARAIAEPDVIVVGAGAAGLAAARELLNAGLSVQILEAGDHVGGRAITESETFGFPYDRGCHWLHNASSNPWVRYGLANGFDVYPDQGDEVYLQDGKPADDGKLEELHAALGRFFERLATASSDRPDAPISAYFDASEPWSMNIASILIHDWYGKELRELSTRDVLAEEEDNDWLCATGFGSLVAYFGRNLPVRTGVEVKTIHWNRNGVRLETNIGSVRSRAAVLTVSTGVLAAETIRFSPRLPVEKTESFHAFPMGVYNHIALLYSGDVFELGRNTYVVPEAKSVPEPGLLSNVDDTGLTMIYVGGNLARDLEREGVGAAIQFGLDHVDKLLGHNASKKFVKGDYTRWGNYPWTLGSYYSVKPGGLEMRTALRRPVDGKLFFAGDACHPVGSATAGRAFETGIEAANDVLAELKVSRGAKGSVKLRSVP
jgi:monoamine oxidase